MKFKIYDAENGTTTDVDFPSVTHLENYISNENKHMNKQYSRVKETNYDAIKKLNIECFAEFLAEKFDCDECPVKNECRNNEFEFRQLSCVAKILTWLKREYNEEEPLFEN